VALVAMLPLCLFWAPLLVIVVAAAPPFVPALSPGCLPPDEQLDLWCPGARGVEPSEGDEAVPCYKIPSLLYTARGTLLAFIEARRTQCGDGGFIDLRLRRSLDAGRTWLASTLVHGEGVKVNATIGDACPVQDRQTGVVHLIFTRNNVDVYYTQSTNEGATWTTPRNISNAVDGHREPGHGFIGTGHAGGLQLSLGRLLVPMHGPCHMIYSDDHGASWARAPGSLSNGGECQVAEVRPGLLMATGRNDRLGWTEISYSHDDGLTWETSKPNHDLPSPIAGVEASLVSHPNGKLYHSAPNSFFLRTHMLIKASDDGGKTWSLHKDVWKGAAGYSALVVMGNGTNAPLGFLYDRNNATFFHNFIFEARGVTFVKVGTLDLPAGSSSSNRNSSSSNHNSSSSSNLRRLRLHR